MTEVPGSVSTGTLAGDFFLFSCGETSDVNITSFRLSCENPKWQSTSTNFLFNEVFLKYDLFCFVLFSLDLIWV